MLIIHLKCIKNDLDRIKLFHSLLIFDASSDAFELVYNDNFEDRDTLNYRFS